MDGCAQAKLELWTREEVDVTEYSIDQDEKRRLCHRTTVSEMLNSKVIKVAGFTRFHFCRQDVIQLVYGHWRNLVMVSIIELKDEVVIKFAESVEPSVETC